MIKYDSKIDPRKIGPLTYVITKNKAGRIEMCQYVYLRLNEKLGKEYTIIGTAPTKSRGLEEIRRIIEDSADQYS